MTLKALIFDVDGTLADTERDGHRLAFNRAFAEAGLDWEWNVGLYGELLAVTGGKERMRPPLSTAPAPPSSIPDRRDSASPGPAFSMADLWPESERESVRQTEAMMAARDAVNAILACDVLVTRVLASAAGLVGTLDAPRDPALVAVLIGLDGVRYLHFRTTVRAARHREPVTMKDAYDGFTFALEARRARDLLRR